MRALKLGIVLGLLAAIALPAGAITITGTIGNQDVKMKISDFDMSVVYTNPDADGGGSTQAAVNGLTQTMYAGAGASGNTYYRANGTAVYSPDLGATWYSDSGLTTLIAQPADLEDSWGIFAVNSITSLDGFTTYWTPGTGKGELVGMFYGSTDNFASGDATTQVIQSSGMHFILWDQTYGTLAGAGGATQGPEGRTGFNEYTGMDDTTIWMEGVAAPVDNTWEFQATVFAQPSSVGGALIAQFSTAIELNGVGQGADIFDNTPDAFIGTYGSADLKLEGRTYATTGTIFSDWTVQSEDPITAHAIPEPFTMLALFGGIGLVGGYIRKTRTRA